MENEQDKPTPDQEPKKGKALSVNRFLLPLFAILLVATAAGSYFMGGRRNTQPSPVPTTPTTSAVESSSTLASPTASPKDKNTPTPTPVVSPTPTPTPTPVPTSTPDNRADLYISAYSFNHEPVMGEPFTLSVSIYNQGNVASGDFTWEWWATTSAPTWACRENVSSIATHGGRVVTCTYTYGGWASYTTRAIVDVGNVVDESNESNNTHSQNIIPIH